MKRHLIDANLKTLAKEHEDSNKAQLVVFDDKLAGFGAVFGSTGASWIVNRRVGDVLKREVIGKWPAMTGTTARKLATMRLGDLAAGRTTPGQEKRVRRSGATVGEAFEMYLEHMKSYARDKSIEAIEEAKKHLDGWKGRALASITGAECRARHKAISTSDSGTHVGNRVFRGFRAVHNWIADEIAAGVIDFPGPFPTSPTRAVQWNVESDANEHVDRRQEPMLDSELPDWYAEVMKLSSPVRSDLNLACILTGIRRTDLCTFRWEHINLADSPVTSRVWRAGKWEPITLEPMSIYRPSPKGGKRRAFSVPVSPQLGEVLHRRKRENAMLGKDDRGWCFPTTALKSDSDKKRGCYSCRDLGCPPHVKGETIHTTEPKENKAKRPHVKSPHRLRDTYTSALARVTPALSPFVIDVLTNHRPPRGSVTAGYVNLTAADLQAAQRAVSEFLVSRFKRPTPKLVAV